MSKPSPSPLVRLLPSLTDVAFIMPLVFIFVKLQGARFLLGDGDTGWHIRAGEWIIQNGRVPTEDVFSYTKAGEPWFAWEWLWDVLFALLHQWWGMQAVVLASIFVICVTTVLVYRLALRMSGDPLVSIFVTFLTAGGASIHWLARPHLFTMLFVVIFLSILERVREGRTRLLVALPFLTIIWVNLHAGFFVGIVLIGAYAAGELVSWLFDSKPVVRQAALARSRQYLACTAACMLASLANPYTYHLHQHVASFLTNSFAFEKISEFLALNFRHPAARYFEVMLMLGVFAAAWNGHRRRYVYPILILGWAHLAMISTRNMPLFMLIAAPVAAAAFAGFLAVLPKMDLASWVRRSAAVLADLSAEIKLVERMPRSYLASVASFTFLILLFSLPDRPSKFEASYDPKRYPEAAIDLLRDAGATGNIFTDDEWGDYLIYRLYPDVKVFADGRSDMYGREFFERFIRVIEGKHDWEEILASHNVRTVLLPVKASLSSTLKHANGWRVVYDDGLAIVFQSDRRPGPALSVKAPEANRYSAGKPAENAAKNAANSFGDLRITDLYARRVKVL